MNLILECLDIFIKYRVDTKTNINFVAETKEIAWDNLE